jgi:hypothetical protein
MFLPSNFNMKDMGEANVILDIKVIGDNDCTILSHTHYLIHRMRNAQ